MHRYLRTPISAHLLNLFQSSHSIFSPLELTDFRTPSKIYDSWAINKTAIFFEKKSRISFLRLFEGSFSAEQKIKSNLFGREPNVLLSRSTLSFQLRGPGFESPYAVPTEFAVASPARSAKLLLLMKTRLTILKTLAVAGAATAHLELMGSDKITKYFH